MLNNLFKMRGRKPYAPKLYDLTCTACDYKEMVRLVDDVVVVTTQTADAQVAEPRDIESLPKACPRCGAALKHKKVPAYLNY